ncbi:MAG: oligosaccharide flippase family protein [Lachnospiraceae bacterium]|nr:oligosaccharide flippase family protein [Lachnospiraceae bacterium]
MNRSRNVSRNLISGILYQIISLILPFAVRTLLIYRMGVEYVGLSNLFSSILVVLSISELGFGNALVFHMYKPIAEGNTEEVNGLLNFYRRIYRVIGFIVAAIGVLIVPFLPLLVKGEYPNDINIVIVYFIYLTNTVLSYLVFSYSRSLFIASQRVDYDTNIRLITVILKHGLQILILLHFSNYYVYAVVIPLSQLFNNLATFYYSRKKYPQYRCEGRVDKKTLDNIIKQVKGLFIQKIGQIVYESFDSIVISAFLGLSMLGIYNNYYYILTSLTGFLYILYSSLRPSVGNSIVKESKEKNKIDFYRFNFGYVWLTGWMAITMFVLYQPFMRLWVGENYMLPTGIPLLLAIYFFVSKECNMLAVYSEAAGLWYENRYTSLIASLMNLIINIILVNRIGLYGVILSSIVCALIVSNIGFMRTLFKHYFENLREGTYYLIKQYAYIALFICVGYFTWRICELIRCQGVIELFTKGIVCMLFPNVIMFLLFRKTDSFTGLLRVLHRKVKA